MINMNHATVTKVMQLQYKSIYDFPYYFLYFYYYD
jgi:hypothetical protein